jgi:hypothetical protein
VADRESVFSDPRIIKILTDQFIPATGDDWYLRRQQDAPGELLRLVAEQGPRAGQPGTRQGRYAFTPSGQLLGFNNNRSTDRLLTMLEDALAAWHKLPKDARSSLAPQAADTASPRDPRFDRRLPAGTAIIRTYTRTLTWDEASQAYTACAPDGSSPTDGAPVGLATARDHLWLQPQEMASLIQALASVPVGDELPLPTPIAHRIARYHLVDNTRGEPDHWTAAQIRQLDLTLTRTGESTASLVGDFHLATEDGARSYQGALAGDLKADADTLSHLHLIAIGDHEGISTYTPGARPGATPLGILFELVPSPTPSDQVPPQAARDLNSYWNPPN